jgi:hypothetical protein
VYKWGKEWFVRELPKNGDVPKSRFFHVAARVPSAGTISNLKIDLGLCCSVVSTSNSAGA